MTSTSPNQDPGPNEGLRVRRSVLYMPAANERALEKAKSIPTDAIIFDLEDAVAPEAKEAARLQAVAAVRSGAYGNRELTIRCNGLDTPWGAADLSAAASSGASAVVIPKVGSVAYLDEVCAILDAAVLDTAVLDTAVLDTAVLDAAGAPAPMAIWAMIETPSGVFDVRQIVAHPRVELLIMGNNDLYRELRAQMMPNRHPILSHLANVVMAAREANKLVLDGVYNDVRDPEGFLIEARHGFEMGFDGKTLIHPNQVEPANEVWTPSAEEIAHAKRVIEAFSQASAEGRGVVTVDGRLVENLHVEIANQTLAVASAVAAKG